MKINILIQIQIRISYRSPKDKVYWLDCGEIKKKSCPHINSFYDWDSLISLCVAGFLSIEPTKKKTIRKYKKFGIII